MPDKLPLNRRHVLQASLGAAAWAATAIVFPGQAIPLQYTTTSSRLHTLLGVANTPQ